MKNSRAYIIDDEEDICILLQLNLSRKFKAVKYAVNLKQGISYLNKNKVDIIFLDNNLPDGSGIEQIKTIRKKNPNAIIIVISALNLLRDSAMEAGADDFLGKPISFKIIREVINRYYPSPS
jgi:DNA-binding response OmpR family regulator